MVRWVFHFEWLCPCFFPDGAPYPSPTPTARMCHPLLSGAVNPTVKSAQPLLWNPCTRTAHELLPSWAANVFQLGSKISLTGQLRMSSPNAWSFVTPGSDNVYSLTCSMFIPTQNLLLLHQSQSGIWQCLNPFLYSQSLRIPSSLLSDDSCSSLQRVQTKTSVGLRL